MHLEKSLLIEIRVDIDPDDLIETARRLGGSLDRDSLLDALQTILQKQEDDTSNWHIVACNSRWGEHLNFDLLVNEAQEALKGLCDICKKGECYSGCNDPACICDSCPHIAYECRHCGEQCEDESDLLEHEEDCPSNPERIDAEANEEEEDDDDSW